MKYHQCYVMSNGCNIVGHQGKFTDHQFGSNKKKNRGSWDSMKSKNLHVWTKKRAPPVELALTILTYLHNIASRLRY